MVSLMISYIIIEVYDDVITIFLFSIDVSILSPRVLDLEIDVSILMYASLSLSCIDIDTKWIHVDRN